MMRSLVVFLLFVFGMFFAGLYLAYGQIDPCRALSVEQARRSAAPSGIAKLWTRIDNAGMSRPSCTLDLVKSWRDRLVD
jgi:hypothetical protein